MIVDIFYYKRLFIYVNNFLRFFWQDKDKFLVTR